ncbi:MAG: pseudouridine synthase [Aquabacterium sp.]
MSTDPMPSLHRLYEDERLYVVDKPAGLLVHPSALDAHETDTALQRAERQAGQRLWPAHRLDRGTSGVLVLARDVDAARHLGAAFEAGAVHKHYLALLRGWPATPGEGGVVDHPLARDPERPSTGQATRAAVTRWQCLARYDWPFATDPRHATSRYALVQAWPETGRRHQIRRHFKHLAHPIVGDSTHGKGPHNRAVAAHLGLARLWLHALEIRFAHPTDGRALTLRSAPGPAWPGAGRAGVVDSLGEAALSALGLAWP